MSISPMFYEQLFRAQIPKVQKKTDNITVFFALSHVNTAFKTLVKLTPGINFTSNLRVPFSYKSVLHNFSLVKFWLCNYLAMGSRRF